MTRACYKCTRADVELRPYGEGGRDVCFDCAFSTPEDKATTEAQFDAQLTLAGDVAILTEYGPKKHGAKS